MNSNKGKEVTRLSTIDANREMKKRLREAFPGVKFSCRMSRGTAYGNVHVGWIDGPNEKDVQKVTEQFRSEGFDGMTDSTTRRDAVIEIDGQRFHSSIGLLSTTRRNSPEAMATAEAKLASFGYSGSESEVATAARMICNGESIHSSAAIHGLS